MNMALNVLHRTFKRWKAAKTEADRKKIADEWFEQNAEVHIEELKILLKCCKNKGAVSNEESSDSE